MVGGEEQVLGVRIQVPGSGVRGEHDEHLLPAFCFLPTAYCIWEGAARAKNPPSRSLSPGNLFGLICFENMCRLSGR